MRTTIWKYALRLEDGVQLISMPIDSVACRVAMQEGNLCVWAEVDPESGRVMKEFVVVGTGHRLPGGLFRHVGGCDHGPFVWHVYMNAGSSDSASAGDT